MSFGSSPFAIGLGFGLPAPAEEARTKLYSSRRIDGVRKRYVISDDGGFEPMSDTAQRVLCLVSYAPQPGKWVIERELRASEQALRAQLALLTNSQEPAIAIIEISTRDDGKQGTQTTVKYKDLATSKIDSVVR